MNNEYQDIYRGHKIVVQCDLWPVVGPEFFVIRNQETGKYIGRAGRKQEKFKTMAEAKAMVDEILDKT